MTDLEIARSVTPKPIFEVAQTLGIRSEDLVPFGRYGLPKRSAGERIDVNPPSGEIVGLA